MADLATVSSIQIRGARIHNLANLDCDIPLHQLVAVTGLSGAGKSSLIFATLYETAKRRFLLGTGARSTTATLSGKVDAVRNLPYTIGPSRARERSELSTFGTATELTDFLGLLYFHLGKPHCPNCEVELQAYTTEEMVELVGVEYQEQDVLVGAPIRASRTPEIVERLEHLRTSGFTRILCGVESHNIDEIDEHVLLEHIGNCAVLIDRFRITPTNRERLRESLELASAIVDGDVEIYQGEPPMRRMTLAHQMRCMLCSFNMAPLSRSSFSYYLPSGACEVCRGKGYENESVCHACGGTRLRREVAAVRSFGVPFGEASQMTVEELSSWVGSNEWQTLPTKRVSVNIIRRCVEDLHARLRYLRDVGLSYLAIDRAESSLSGGELRRSRLASQLGSSMSGVLFLFDEPSAGLHAHDITAIRQALRTLVDCGNSVIAIEHNGAVISDADYILELGPGAGPEGGKLVHLGTVNDLLAGSGITADVVRASTLKERRLRKNTTTPPERWLVMHGVSKFNLKDLTARIPKEKFVVVTGVSGSGKSALVTHSLHRALKYLLGRRRQLTKNESALALTVAEQESSGVLQVEGWEEFERVIDLSSRMLQRNMRSTVATASGILDPIRELFAQTIEARARGLSPSHFSFNAKGACEYCDGTGDVFDDCFSVGVVTHLCGHCAGSRYASWTTEIRYHDRTIAETLELTVLETLREFSSIPQLKRILTALEELGLGYLQLSESTDTLSDGEWQRLQLGAALSSRGRTGTRTLYLFDEPSQGLHLHEVERLYGLFQRLIKEGHSVVAVEHNLSLIRNADYIIDLGTDAGPRGGHIAAQGTPDELRNSQASIAEFL